MTLQYLKQQIENRTVSDDLLIFICKPDNYILHQYIEEIASIHRLQRTVVDTLDDQTLLLCANQLSIYFTDKLEELPKRQLKNCIIVAQKINKNIIYSNIVELPKLEPWMLLNYAHSNVKLDDYTVFDAIFSLIKDPYKLKLEVDKLKIFEPSQQQSVFEQLCAANQYSDITDKNIFDFSNALFQKNTKVIADIYKIIQYCDIEPLGLLTILYNNIKNMMLVTLQKYPNEENTGLKSNQIFAIKKAASAYSREQLIKLFNIVSSLDFKLKNGLISENMLVDYLVISILSI